MTKDEALKMALEALRWTDEWRPQGLKEEAITAIKEALAQPEQEPIGEIVDAIEGAFKCSFTKMLPVGTKLYTTPPQRTWVGLTEREQGAIMEDLNAYGTNLYQFAQAIEAKLRSKNS